jgi:BirA family transcriptional regulator, biotin operon repressor / biotin---[acetyl-CoA-carboxylase] ligase
MSFTAASLLDATTAPEATAWQLSVLPETTSTNTLAATLPPWHAIRAAHQSAGRGRTGRTWVSDRGGLWLSAVLPCPAPRERWALLPLAVGWALLETLADLGARDLRLRWPNDLLCGERKLAGLLVERHRPDTAVVGLGLNVLNRPEFASPTLRGTTVRLADLAPDAPTDLDTLATHALAAIARAHAELCEHGFARIAADLNRGWATPRLVALTLADAPAPVLGRFLGIAEDGRLRLAQRDGTVTAYDATQVALLRELPAA